MTLSRIAGALLIVAGLCAGLSITQSVASAHGGSFRGPGGTLPPGAGPAGPRTPGSGAPANTDQVGWQMWWNFNRDPYLDLKAAIYRVQVQTGADDFFIGHGQKDAPPSDLRPPAALIRTDVVPKLIEVLENETNKDLVSSALLAIGKIGVAGESPEGPPLVSVIKPHLASNNQEIAESAAIALGVLADRTAATTLAAVLADSRIGRNVCGKDEVPYRTRAFAAYGLGLVGFRSDFEDVRRYATHHLIGTLESDDSSQKDLRVACLLSIGLVRLEIANREFGDDGPRASTSREGQINFLLNFFGEKRSDQVLAYVPVTLARLAFDAPPEVRGQVIDTFLAALERNSKTGKQVQQSVVAALGLLGDDDDDGRDAAIRETLRRIAKDGERMAQRLAMVSLAKTTARPGKGGGGDENARDVRAYFQHLLASGTSTIRPWAALSLGLFENHRIREGKPGSPDSRAALRFALEKAKGPDEESACAIALGLARDDSAEEALTDIVENQADDILRGYSAIALGLIDARSAIEPLRRVVRDATYRPQLLRDASTGLGLMGDKALVPELVDMLREAKSLGTQASVASALGFIGDVRSVAPLVTMINDEDLSDTARAFGCVAIGIVCDKEPLPFNAKLSSDVNYWLAPPSLLDPAGGTGVLDLL